MRHKPQLRNQRKKGTLLGAFALVAEVGFEPHDLRVMSPTSYQAALLRDILSLGGAGDRDRTGTILTYHGILSPGRLPVPPHRQGSTERLCAPLRFACCIIPHLFPFVNPFFAFLFFYLRFIFFCLVLVILFIKHSPFSHELSVTLNILYSVSALFILFLSFLFLS